MRILIYSYNYYPEPIGIAPLMTELAEGLVTRGHEVRVITAMPNYPERQIYPPYRGKLYTTEERHGVKIQRSFVLVYPKPGLACRFFLELSFICLSFVQALRGWKPDIIFHPSPSLPASLPVAALKTLYRCPTVLNVQDILPEAAIHTGLLSNPVAIRLFETLEAFAYGTATCTTVIANDFRDNLQSKGVPHEKMVTIPNWVDVDFIAPRPRETSQFRKRHGLGDNFVVLYTGNIATTQGVRNALRAARGLGKYPDIRLVIVGESSQLKALDQFRQQLDLTNVLLLPFVPRQELPDMLAAADVGLILQKRNMVGFNMPSKIQILLASGRPILASVPYPGAAARAILSSGGGIVVEPENPTALMKGVLELYHHPDQARVMGQQGRLYALENLAFHAALDHYEALFEGMVRPSVKVTNHPNSTLAC